MKPYRANLMVCAGTACVSNGSFNIKEALEREIIRRKLDNEIQVVTTGCNGFCAEGPLMTVQPDGIFYGRLKEEDIPYLVEEHFLKGRPVKRLMFTPPETETPVPIMSNIEFFKHQMLIALRNRGLIDPEKIDEYIGREGYYGLRKVLTSMTPDEVIKEVKESGLRGRGGAGFPTGVKWGYTRAAKGDVKYVVCNADEGDPGAYMDRSIIESDPHSVLEGMTIGAYAIGASVGHVYIRNEYPLALKHLLVAIDQAKDYGLLGEDILGSGFDFNIEVTRGAGAFVCGEETALMASIEGRLGNPRPRPPFPTTSGLWGKPTNINNVETWANIPVIINRGAKWFAEIGTETSKGTKVFSLVGKINNTGLVEVPMGITLSDIIYKIGGGIPGGKKFKAVQTGGPSGGCIPAEKLDLPVDYESLSEAGSIMGSGGMVVMDETTCMVDVARYFLAFTKNESCGKCTPCREGIAQLHGILTRITEGDGTLDDLEMLEKLSDVIKNTAICGLGKTAPNPVLSTMRYFKDEYLEHIINKRCPAKVCKELVGAPCQNACPLGTEAWRYVAHIARGEHKEAYRVIRETNPFPSVCARVCDHKCEQSCRLGTTGADPVAIRALKRFITDTIPPSAYDARRESAPVKAMARVAVIGAGPAGLTAAHQLSLKGYNVTIFEAEAEPGGMLVNCIPAYRLPRETLKKEIASLINQNITLEYKKSLGKDISVQGLLDQGFKAIFIAIGAQKAMRLHLEGEDTKGCYPSIDFLKAFNLRGENWAKGRVGVIGGGNSAIDAARTALRQKDVTSVAVIYRRSNFEMPAYKEEIEAAIEEGIEIKTLVSPTRILSHEGHITGIECVENMLGELDSSGRRRPVPVSGSEFSIPLDTLIVAVSEQPDTDSIASGASGNLKADKSGALIVDPQTLACGVEGVFAGGDAVTGPNTVVDAIAAGKKVAIMIDRYLRGEPLRQAMVPSLPKVYVAPCTLTEEEQAGQPRFKPTKVPAEKRKSTLEEIEKTMSRAEARKEAQRCLRCDLEFTERSMKI